MKVFVVLACVALARAGNIYNEPGSSTSSRSQDVSGNYNFGYNEQHASGGSFRSEQGTPGQQVGSYGLVDADGRQRRVDYVADAYGFRATVNTNEPGTKADSPAATVWNGPQPVAAVAAPVAKVLAPAPLQLAAPIQYAAPALSYAKTLAAPAIGYAQAPLGLSTVQFSTQLGSLAAPVQYAQKVLAAPAALGAY